MPPKKEKSVNVLALEDSLRGAIYYIAKFLEEDPREACIDMYDESMAEELDISEENMETHFQNREEINAQPKEKYG